MRNEREEKCPNKARHTPTPQGYVAFHEWCKKMGQTHNQIQCPDCGLWAIWVEKGKKSVVKMPKRQK